MMITQGSKPRWHCGRIWEKSFRAAVESVKRVGLAVVAENAVDCAYLLLASRRGQDLDAVAISEE
jgi:hypothetical protein